MTKDYLTDEEVEKEIERLLESPDVKLAKKEQRIRYRRRQYLYHQHGPKRTNTINKLPVRVSETEKIAVLKYAHEFGPSAAAREYNIAASTIRLWNNTYRIYETRKHRTFSPEQKREIIDCANTDGIATAARKYNVIGSQIQDWINNTNQK